MKGLANLNEKYSLEKIEFCFNWIITLYHIQQYKIEKENNKKILKQIVAIGDISVSL